MPRDPLPRRDAAALVLRAKAGDEDAFEHLCRSAIGVLISVCHRRGIRDDGIIEDILQEAMLKAWRRIGTLIDATHATTWLASIVKNQCTDHARSVARRPVVESLDPDQLPDADAAVSRNVEAAEFWYRVSQLLSAEDVIIVNGSYVDDLSDRELGAHLDLTPGAVKMRRLRALQRLRVHLEGS